MHNFYFYFFIAFLFFFIFLGLGDPASPARSLAQASGPGWAKRA
jgi:hypothetical protein